VEDAPARSESEGFLLEDRYALPSSPEKEGYYPARDTLTGHEVTIRALRVPDEPVRKRFIFEGQLLSRINHTHLMNLWAVAAGKEDWVYVSLTAESGPTLREEAHLYRRFPILRAARITAGLSWALSLLHREGIVYGDLDPSRVHLRGRDVARLAGLERVRGADGLSPQSGVGPPGDPAYLASEVLDGRPPTRAADLFSLGCILYELLVGEAPATGRTPEETIEKGHLIDSPQLFPPRLGVPHRMKKLLRALLAKDPSARPSQTAEVASTLDAVAERLQRRPWYR
jgi:serine/threonine protein kinase